MNKFNFINTSFWSLFIKKPNIDIKKNNIVKTNEALLFSELLILNV